MSRVPSVTLSRSMAVPMAVSLQPGSSTIVFRDHAGRGRPNRAAVCFVIAGSWLPWSEVIRRRPI